MGGYLGIGLAVWLGLSTLWELGERIKLGKIPFSESFRRLKRQPRASWGMTIAHFGLAIGIAGMTGAGNWKVESIQVMQAGDRQEVAGYTYVFNGSKLCAARR